MKITALCLFLMTLNHISLKAEHSIIPEPLEFHASNEKIILPQKIDIVLPEKSSGVIKYAAGILGTELKQNFACQAKLVPFNPTEKQNNAIYLGNADSSFIRDIFKKENIDIKFLEKDPEAYIIIKRPSSSIPTIIAGGSEGGIIYGCLTFLQLLEENKNNKEICIPKDFFIKDKPSFLIRGVTGVGDLDWYARCRINAIYSENFDIFNPQFIENCNIRGITPYACIGFLGTNISFKNKNGRYLSPALNKDLKLLESKWKKAAKNGAKGLILLFDDLPAEMVKHYKDNFGDLASAQIPFIEKIISVAKKYEIKNLIVCPTPYGSWWMTDKDNYAYFKKLSRFEKEGIKFYHCTYRDKGINELKKCGINNYVWWYNHCNVPGGSPGLFSRNEVFKKEFIGFRPFVWGWYSVEDSPKEMLRVFPDALPQMKTLSERTKDAWICGTYGGQELMQWGIYLWRPSAYNPESSFVFATEAYLGKNSYPDYRAWEKIARKWLLFLANGKRLNKENFWQFSNDKEKALKSLDQLSHIIKSDKKEYIDKMKKQLFYLENELKLSNSEQKQASELETPEFMLAPCERPPVIDGKINPDEWADACAFTEFLQLSSGKSDGKNSRCWITYDAKHNNNSRIYVAIRTKLPVNGKLLSKKDKIWEGDAVELFLNPGLTVPIEQRAYYHFVGNSVGDIHESRCPSNGAPWHGNWIFKNSVKNGFWDAEISIPVKDLGVAQYQDGSINPSIIGINIVRDQAKPTFQATSLSMAPENFHDPKTMAKAIFNFPFASECLVAQELSWGDPATGKIDVKLKIINPQLKACEAEVSIKIISGENKISDKQKITFSNNEKDKTIHFKKDLSPDKKNKISISVKKDDLIFFKRTLKF